MAQISTQAMSYFITCENQFNNASNQGNVLLANSFMAQGLATLSQALQATLTQILTQLSLQALGNFMVCLSQFSNAYSNLNQGNSAGLIYVAQGLATLSQVLQATLNQIIQNSASLGKGLSLPNTPQPSSAPLPNTPQPSSSPLPNTSQPSGPSLPNTPQQTLSNFAVCQSQFRNASSNFNQGNLQLGDSTMAKGLGNLSLALQTSLGQIIYDMGPLAKPKGPSLPNTPQPSGPSLPNTPQPVKAWTR